MASLIDKIRSPRSRKKSSPRKKPNPLPPPLPHQSVSVSAQYIRRPKKKSESSEYRGDRSRSTRDLRQLDKIKKYQKRRHSIDLGSNSSIETSAATHAETECTSADPLFESDLVKESSESTIIFAHPPRPPSSCLSAPELINNLDKVIKLVIHGKPNCTVYNLDSRTTIFKIVSDIPVQVEFVEK